MIRNLLRVILVLLLSLGGCRREELAYDDQTPSDFTLTLFMSSEGQRYTWFVLNPGHTLGFSGGIDARQRTVKHDINLTAKQVDTLWRLIVDERLFEAQSVDGNAPKTRWELKIRSGGGRWSVKTVDHATPAMVKLHKLLFGYQAAQRYNLPGIGSGP